MKKIAIIYVLCIVVLFNGCKRKTPIDSNEPTTTPTAIVPTQAIQTPTPTIKPVDETQRIEDFYPFQPDTIDIFEGKGNEYAAYQTNIDFIDENNKLIQTRTNNGGTETVRVIECKNGKLSVVFRKDECYYRENFMNRDNFDNNPEILLMEPLITGTIWTLENGNQRYISNTEVVVETPLGKYSTIEVTTKYKDGLSKSYYAKNMGLVKEVYTSNDMEVSSSLSKRNIEVPFTQKMDFYYIDSNQDIHIEQKSLSFKTNDSTKIKMQNAMKEVVKKNYVQLISKNTKINSMYKGKDNVVYIDFSKEFVSEMNLGSGYEGMVLQCITDTLGMYYLADEVSITINNKPYESAHIKMKKGETFKVNIE